MEFGTSRQMRMGGDGLREKLQLLPPRRSRPRTSEILPHLQLDRWPSASWIEQLRDWARALPDIIVGKSRLASECTSALCVAGSAAEGPPEAFIDANEFCHLHPPPEGTLHLTLPDGVRQMAVDFCWAEPHLAARSGAVSRCLVLAYAPRDEQELAVAAALIQLSWTFAKGGL